MIRKWLSKTARMIYRKKLQYKGILRYGKGCTISSSSYLEGKNLMLQRCVLDHTSLGFGSYMGNDCVFINTKIGRYCSIGDAVDVIVGDHPTHTLVSCHPAFYSAAKHIGYTYVDKTSYEDIKYTNKEERLCVEIGSDVFLGSHVSILNGVRIGDGAMIGAGSLVVNDVEAYSIYAGVPAKKLRDRFTPEQKQRLAKLRWFDHDEAYLRKHSTSFQDIEAFLQEWENSK